MGDLEVLVNETIVIERSYKRAIAVSDNDWFGLDSSRQQLLILNDLGFRPEEIVKH